MPAVGAAAEGAAEVEAAAALRSPKGQHRSLIAPNETARETMFSINGAREGNGSRKSS